MRHSPETAFQQALEKYRRAIPSAAAANMLPYMSSGPQWQGSPSERNSWWTGGFWPGVMWQLYAATHDEVFLTEARRAQDLLTAEFRSFELLNHDMAFMYLLSTGADYKLTGSEQARADTLHAASLLMGRFNPAGFIRAWNGPNRIGYVIIDCMMNLTLLHWAAQLTGDPRYAHVAKIHADTTLANFLRPDGSVSHIIEFDPATGARVAEHRGQGYEVGSSWSRGQAWGLYGFTLAYMNTQDGRYLAAAEKIAAYFVSCIRPDGLTDCDFRQPAEPERLDNIAGAVAACGLIELARITGNADWRAAAEHLVDGLLDHCFDLTDAHMGLLTHCTCAYHENDAGRHVNIVYGDYFLIEALAKLQNKDPMLWQG